MIPLAPEFVDPPGDPNLYPYFFSSEPLLESTVTFNQGNQAVLFEVTVGDQNLRDVLYYRWIADYPPFVITTTKLLMAGSIPAAPELREVRPTIQLTLRCEMLAPGTQQHRLVVVVADRAFEMNATGPNRYNEVVDRVGPGGSQSPVTYPATAGWSVTCPP